MSSDIADYLHSLGKRIRNTEIKIVKYTMEFHTVYFYAKKVRKIEKNMIKIIMKLFPFPKSRGVRYSGIIRYLETCCSQTFMISKKHVNQ